jgi:hypothetical protein
MDLNHAGRAAKSTELVVRNAHYNRASYRLETIFKYI